MSFLIVGSAPATDCGAARVPASLAQRTCLTLWPSAISVSQQAFWAQRGEVAAGKHRGVAAGGGDATVSHVRH